MDPISTLLPGGAVTVKQTSITSDSQTQTMRTAQELRDLNQLDIEQGLGCTGRQTAMSNMFATSTKRIKYDGC